ncbi:hypothetical protein BGW36DRAFT_428010 [Talaromyces proteolyticus]|uniref:Four-carbon acid sugar kinase N-terminal domain-containing protein n=1 Tax=Talaromyces proteolyticus TaxID=1131652 RepID=A0AAD4KNX0_9EURO|nr:uncharacterized protein BGW36DRAFT_428010 [Talaromyces proteolyticus]KAH8695986.1 hypothetical protein BGW36DRAFT_428010 [Talaromyces proteolyticus]
MADDEKKNPVLSLDETISQLPPPVPFTHSAADIQQLPHDKLPILVVLDDDPTGTQTCHGINVLTVWDAATLEAEFHSGNRGFFILTNSRALPTPQARDLIHEICTAVQKAAAKTNISFEFVLRGDSTLRGHFPDEPEVAEQVSGKADAWILAPFFRQGGRYTINDVHYVLEGGTKLVPAAQTPFAKDATFGYKSSNLVDYVVEKSKGSIPAERVKSISLEDIRVGGANAVVQKLLSFEKGSVVVLNAIVDTDMEIAVQGLLQATTQGKRYLYRTGAAFVSTRLGIEQIPPLSATELELDQSQTSPGGLILAGSYVPKTTEQLECLIDGRGEKLKRIVLDVEELLANSETLEEAISSAVDLAGEYIAKGEDVLVMTSRKLIIGKDDISSLNIGSVVAAALVLFLRLLVPRPRYIIAKGGITSSDAATKSLRMRRAEIRGQAASGVPLWRCTESTSKFSGIIYVVFPGNVGEKHTLRDLVASWEKLAVPKH